MTRLLFAAATAAAVRSTATKSVVAAFTTGLLTLHFVYPIQVHTPTEDGDGERLVYDSATASPDGLGFTVGFTRHVQIHHADPNLMLCAPALMGLALAAAATDALTAFLRRQLTLDHCHRQRFSSVRRSALHRARCVMCSVRIHINAVMKSSASRRRQH